MLKYTPRFNVASSMNFPRKKLPIGIQSLSKIILGGYYFVDKTALAFASEVATA